MLKHKNSSNCLIFELKFLSHVYISMQNVKTIFRRFLQDLKEFFRNMFNCFSDPDCGWQARSVDRAVDRTKGRSTDVHNLCARLSDTGPVDRAVDRTREPCSLYLGSLPEQRACSLYLGGRPGGQPDFPNGHIFDRWRSTASLSGWQISLTAIF